MISLKTTPQLNKSIHLFAVCGFEAKTTALLCFCWCIILTFNFIYYKYTWHFTTRISVLQGFPATGTKVLYKQKMNSRLSVVVLLCVFVTVCIAAGSTKTVVIRECNQLTIAACQGQLQLIIKHFWHQLNFYFLL